MARSFFYFLDFSVHGLPSDHFPPLYPMALSVAYIFKDMHAVYLAMKFINVLISSLIIFPSWLIAKEFLSEKRALSASILISLIPSNFSFSGYIMSENLFYPLFLFSIYFIYKSFTTENFKYKVFSGLFIGLTFLTKSFGLVLFVLVLLMVVFTFKKKNLLILIVGFITALPWILRNMVLHGFNSGSIIGRYGYITKTDLLLTYEGILSFFTWIILDFGFLILASGVFFSILSINFFKKSLKDRKIRTYTSLFLLSLGLILVVISKHHVSSIILHKSLFDWLDGRPVGRYIDVLLPLVFIGGFTALYRFPNMKKLNLIPISLILAFSSQLIFFPLFPINNMSLVWLGILTNFYKPLFLTAIIFFLIPSLIYLIYKKINKNNLIALFMLFFFLLSLTNYSINYTNAKTYWYDGEQMQAGLWFKDNLPRDLNILFDERDCTKTMTKTKQELCSSSFIPMGFWMNNNLKIGNVLKPTSEIDLIISKHKLNYPLIKESGEIKIYKIK
tara:strand:+ start:588 stop:2096 length:1509 start_codon:yes stop_codon:yes gene_type:complete